MLNRPNIGVGSPQTLYRIVRALYLLIVIGLVNAGIRFESAPLLALGGVLFVGFLPASRWLGTRLGIEENDERVRRLIRTAASRALYALFAIGFLAYVLGALLDAQGSLSGPVETFIQQGEIVFVWVGMTAIASSVVHKGWNLLRARRLEG
ncbi:hypothetical protein [Halorhabdus sp. CBA1104]|uniref:hypothetical protein n=1 Tax=Halorhabdus sp. CBA1104 TaxID=1380432 RepID=UPI0012B2DC63|nr:hypothetical protein [Halorhabdus sp. CBA1104]